MVGWVFAHYGRGFDSRRLHHFRLRIQQVTNPQTGDKQATIRPAPLAGGFSSAPIPSYSHDVRWVLLVGRASGIWSKGATRLDLTTYAVTALLKLR